jgi:hypothetical protein
MKIKGTLPLSDNSFLLTRNHPIIQAYGVPICTTTQAQFLLSTLDVCPLVDGRMLSGLVHRGHVYGAVTEPPFSEHTL